MGVWGFRGRGFRLLGLFRDMVGLSGSPVGVYGLYKSWTLPFSATQQFSGVQWRFTWELQTIVSILVLIIVTTSALRMVAYQSPKQGTPSS